MFGDPWPGHEYSNLAWNEADVKAETGEKALSSGPAPGRYRHYKGNFYQVIGVATHTETREELVVYRALYGEGWLLVRPLAMFLESVEHEGAVKPRFELCG